MIMNDLLEVRWVGRGGQGAVTAAKMLAESALAEGKHIQAFPEFGPERMGAPVKSFTRISSKPITIHCQVIEPHVSILLDPTLLGTVDITEGVGKDGIIIINTKDTPARMRQKMCLKNRRLYTVDASGIALKFIKRNIPNTPMLAAVIKVTAIMELESVARNFRQQYSGKFTDEIIKANIEAMRAAYEQTKQE